jgi:hypothetical protein
MKKLLINFKQEFAEYTTLGLVQRCILIAIAIYLVYMTYADQVSFYTIASGTLAIIWFVALLWQGSVFIIYASCLALRFLIK